MTTRKKAAPDAAGEIEAKLKESAGRIWLAGLGALSLAEKEGGKLFKSLVEKGETLEVVGREQLDRAKDQLGSAATAAKERIDDVTVEVRERAGAVMSKVERELDERVNAALERVGVPSRNEISRLTKRIEELTDLVEKQAKRRPAAPRKVAKKRAARR